jgi:hypothetical protein
MASQPLVLNIDEMCGGTSCRRTPAIAPIPQPGRTAAPRVQQDMTHLGTGTVAEERAA